MLIGAHSIIYRANPEADRAFLRGVPELPNVDVGDGWLIFGLPPAELVVHPCKPNDVHKFYVLCGDAHVFVAEMPKHHLVCAPVWDAGWGLLTQPMLPGGCSLRVYQPRHARPEVMSASKGPNVLQKGTPRTRKKGSTARRPNRKPQ